MDPSSSEFPIPLAVSLKVSASTLRSLGDDLYWVESRPDLQGHSVVVRWSRGGEPEAVSPEGYSFVSRLHEYGGGAMEILDLDGPLIVAVTVEQTVVKFRPGGNVEDLARDIGHVGDLRLIPNSTTVLAVRECTAESPVKRSVLAIDVEHATLTTLLEGRDFFADVAADGDGNFACCVWDHPDMPWDAAEIVTGALTLGTSPTLSGVTTLIGGKEHSALHPTFLKGRIVAAGEDGEWSRVVVLDLVSGGETWVVSDGCEHGVPLWVVGRRQFLAYQDGWIGIAREGGFSRVLSSSSDVFTKANDFPDELCATSEGFAWLGGTTSELGVVVRHDSSGRELERRSVGPPLHTSLEITEGVAVSASSRYGEEVFGILFTPAGLQRPPVVVSCHGGPTAVSQAGFNPIVQVFTSRGFAVLLANYGGSTGYGARYRHRLDGQWGIIDVEDCVDLVQGLGRQGLVDAERAAIRGGSAGGFTTLLGLCTGVFSCGVSHYGVADLRSLAAVTHDFESRYMDRLVGPLPEAESVYEKRSAVTKAGEMRGHVLLLQGLDDPVVPPSQARAMHDALRANGQPVELVEYEGESHGFRRADTLIDALQREVNLFATVLLSSGSQ